MTFYYFLKGFINIYDNETNHKTRLIYPYIFIYEPMYYMGFFMSINKKIIKPHHD